MTELMVVDPVQGEALDLAAATPDRLGQLLLDVREHENRLRELKMAVSDELHRRWDRSRQWSETTPSGLKLSGKSDAPVVTWDVHGLLEELDQMVIDGLLDRKAVQRAVDVKTEWVVSVVGVNALLKSPALAERIAQYRTELPASNRRVSVTHA